MASDIQTLRALAESVSARFQTLSQVLTITWAGSGVGPNVDAHSDVDLYIYTETEIPPVIRAGLIGGTAQKVELDNRFWEPGDEWIDRETGVHVDVMYRDPQWIQGALEQILVRHQASIGYSTCFWHNVLVSEVIFDRNDWFTQLQQWARRPYPEPLRRAIIAKNYPILRDNLSSYYHQISLAIARGDHVSTNHRVAALLASYFDILFAVNRMPHPGEKRLIAWAEAHCDLRPPDFAAKTNLLLQSTASSDDPALLEQLDVLLDDLDLILVEEGLLPAEKGKRR